MTKRVISPNILNYWYLNHFSINALALGYAHSTFDFSHKLENVYQCHSMFAKTGQISLIYFSLVSKGWSFLFFFYKKGDELLVVWYLDCWFEMENCEFGLFQEIFTFFNFFFKMPNRDKNRTAAQSPFWTFSFEFRKITIQCNIRPKFGTFEPK